MDGRRRHERIFRSHRGYFHVRSLRSWSLKRYVTFLMPMFILIHSRWTDAVQVIGGDQTVVIKETTVLPCKLINGREDLTQISWQRKTRGKPKNDNFYTILYNGGPKFVNGHDDRFEFAGDVDKKDGSLKLSNVTLLDEGVYTCIFTLFPSGNHQAEINLNIYVPPVTHVEANAPLVGDEEVPLASCTAAGSKPAATMTWKTDSLGEKVKTTTNSTLNANDTTTTVISLWGVPTREINGGQVQCVVSTPALPNEKTLPIIIQVHYPPGEVTVKYTSPNLVDCVADANPPPEFTWSTVRRDQSSSAVVARGSTLDVAKEEDGLYQCKASNQHGSGRVYLQLHTKPGSCEGWKAAFSISFIVNVIGISAFCYFYISKDWVFDLPKSTPRRNEGTEAERRPVRGSDGSDTPIEADTTT